MQIVIDIPDKVKEMIDDNLNACDLDVYDCVMLATRNGTPLPELFDLEGLKSDMKTLNCGFPYELDYLLDCLNKRLGITIIEAEE